jgi:hypothetical protein
MKTKALMIIAILLSAVFIAGCMEFPPEEQELPKVEDLVDEPMDIPGEEPIIEPEPMGTECSTDPDCKDDDYCTTDACINGNCFNTLITGCLSKTEAEPHFVEVNLGEDEWIKLYAENYKVYEWTIRDVNDTVYYMFPDFTKLNNYVTIHSGNGLATAADWYLFKKDFWNPGDTLYLKDKEGVVIDEITGE